MKKVININFQGRVVPIEESAYEMLQQYITSLRNYFANEDGRDEIVNDIESRIGELFEERLKKGASCIADEDVDAVMNNMGRPSDFEKAEQEETQNNGPQAAGQANTGQQSQPNSGFQQTTSRKRLYRDESDKILGGVCSGIAHYLNLDPAIVRIIFALLIIVGGTGFLAYIILWIVLPSTSLITNVRKRLYRDTEDRVFQGVCGGLGKYFDISPALPRIIFAAPFILGIITSIGHSFFFNWSVQIGGFGGLSFFFAYVILWIVVPEAKTASEKLEMKGEKVDVNSIRDTIIGDLNQFKDRAEKMGAEFKTSAQRFGTEAKENFGNYSKRFGAEAGQAVRRNGSGIGHALGIIIKAFFYFIGGAIAIGLFIALVALMGSGVAFLPIRDYVLAGAWEHMLAWASLALFIGVPIIAIIVWFIRRISRVKTQNRYLGLTFTSLWFIGLFCVIALVAMISSDFSSGQSKDQEVFISQPANNLLNVDLGATFNTGEDYTWAHFDGFPSIGEDSLLTNNVRVNVVKSNDSLYHVQLIKLSDGRSVRNAEELIEKIKSDIQQQGNMLMLPEGFFVARSDKWRNQRVLVVIAVPEGKKIKLTDRLNSYDWFNINWSRRHRTKWTDDWNNGYGWEANKEMIMTSDDLKTQERIDKEAKEKLERDEKKTQEDNSDQDDNQPQKKLILKDTTRPKNQADTTYHYHAANFKPQSEGTTEPIETGMNMMDVSPLSSLLQ
eukprot:gnl/Spiro4/2607_TR1256_c0_g1_i1.p1 gnl/Spiro4/2607_TR1256_c0_g1~~gnl/Spiro4/2607_TR1256_c0_g1_i1.p1  ORF type:complete len:726 (+),score=-72.21 gnl/Spiro4/2607_TR1256_c0_g1_i1:514-2691(+)